MRALILECHACGFEHKEAYALTYVGFYADKEDFVGPAKSMSRRSNDSGRV